MRGAIGKAAFPCYSNLQDPSFQPPTQETAFQRWLSKLLPVLASPPLLPAELVLSTEGLGFFLTNLWIFAPYPASALTVFPAAVAHLAGLFTISKHPGSNPGFISLSS